MTSESGARVSDTGRLVLAATPLGDAADASPKLREVLRTADVIAAEDTRRLRSLCAVLEVSPCGRIVSCYDAVEASRVPRLVDAVASGSMVVLVTDAGMPSVSDPGFRLAAACAEAGLPVRSVPGPSAVTTALAVSGLPCDRFCFEGFAPRKQSQRRRWLAELVEQRRTVVFFESPHRLAATLDDAASVLGAERRGAVCRELSKTYEQVLRGGLGELAEAVAEGVRGEITVVLEGAPAPEPAEVESLVPQVRALVDEGYRLKDAAATVAERHGVSKKSLYDAAVAAR